MDDIENLKKYDFKQRFFNSREFSNSKGIYLLFRKDNGKCIYVGRTTGKTSSLSRRLAKHFEEPTYKLKNNIRAANGEISFSCIVMNDKDESQIKKMESDLIIKLNTLRYGNAKKGDNFE